MKSKYSPLIGKRKKRETKKEFWNSMPKMDQYSRRAAAVRHRDFYHQHVAQ